MAEAFNVYRLDGKSDDLSSIIYRDYYCEQISALFYFTASE